MKQCQSCGMPLLTEKAGDCRGTEIDKSFSDKWCILCYENGAFVGPDCTVDQMISIVDTALKKDGRSAMMRWLARNQIPRLERWR